MNERPNQAWISVDDELPPDDVPVVITVEKMGFHYGPDPIRGWKEDNKTSYKVTQWKPL